MQIHELNNFTGTLGSGSYLAIDDGTDTGKISSQGLLAATEARIDNIIAGPAPSAEEIVDARLGADGVTYPSLGDAIRDQFTDVKADINVLDEYALITNEVPISLTSTAGVIRNSGVIDYAQYTNLVHYNVTVNAGEEYTVMAYSQGSTTYPFCVFWDENDTSVGNVPAGDNGVVTKTFIVPSGAVSMSINNNTNTAANPATCVRTDYLKSSDLIYANTENISTLMPKDYNTSVTLPTAEAGVMKSSGTVEHEQYERYVHYVFNVNPYEWYKATAHSFNDAQHPFFLVLNSDGQVIKTVFSENVGQTGKGETHVVQIPSDGVELVLNNDTISTSAVVKKAQLQAVEDYVQEALSYWKGKKIVWFGTSIPAGVTAAGAANGSGSYPTRIGEMLGATVYNESVGSSQARAGAHGSITADDPMGYGGCSAVSLLYSLSLSSSEKQDIADNWDSKWKDIITWYGDQVDFNNLTYYKNSSWDIKLAKYLTGGAVGQCDLYVFDHGYNDSIKTLGYTDLSDVPSTPNDRTYFLGAMRFLFEKILADNPKASILIIGHYCTDGRSGNFLTKYVTDAQTDLAETWQYPFVETWKYMGFNHQQITVNGSPTTPAQQWMPDDVHPSSDTTGAALKHYAEVLYPFVRDAR